MESRVGFITIHPTPTKEIYELSLKRLVPVTSRGGGLVIKDALAREWKYENVYLKLLPEIVKAAKKFNTS